MVNVYSSSVASGVILTEMSTKNKKVLGAGNKMETVVVVHTLDLTRHPMVTTTITINSDYKPTIPFLKSIFRRSWNRSGTLIDTDETIDRR